ncbi:MAG: PD40 domain-containing protein, partial [Planctomycetes bacterium]|nr:PD40 domain-containing protein [Planctomycetota bacterium]
MPLLVAIYLVARWEVHAFWSIGFSPDGTMLVTTSGTFGGQPSDLRVWDPEMRQELFHFRHPSGVLVAKFSPDGKTLAAGNWDGTISLWEVATWRELRVLKAHESVVRSVAFSPDSEKLVTSCVDGSVKLWDVATGAVESEVSHGGYVNEIALSPDGKTLATAGERPVKLWSITGGKVELLPTSLANTTEPVTFSPDGKMIVAEDTSTPGTISFWDSATAQVSMSIAT